MDIATMHEDPELWIPGQGVVALGQRQAYKKAARTINDYDERLMLGLNQATGEWVVFLKRGPEEFGDRPYPVLGLGHELPHPDEIKARLFKADAVRNGEAIIRQINDTNAKRQKELDDNASEATSELAEGIESFLHAQGRTPYHRSLRKQDRKHRIHATGKD